MDTRVPAVVVDTHDTDEAIQCIASVYGTHTMRVEDRHREFHAVHTETRLGHIAIDTLEYGADVRVDSPSMERWVLVTTPVRGHLTISSGSSTRTLAPGDSVAIDSQRLFALQWHQDCALRTIRLPAQHVDESARMLGREFAGPARFGLEGPRSPADARSWRSLIDLAERESRRSGPYAEPGLVSAQLAQLISSMLVTTHALGDSDGTGCDAALPQQLRVAIELMEAHPDRHLPLSVVAAEAGVGVRTLQAGFRLHLDTTPTEYLRRIRLERAHRQLLHADLGDGTTVAEVAHTWGFGNLGRFSRTYRERFGQVPSHTLRQ